MYRSYGYGQRWWPRHNKESYTIYDDEFVERDILIDYSYSVCSGLGQAVIIAYEKRNANVVLNLIAAFQELRIPMYMVLDDNRKHNPLYGKYADQLEKLLVLI